MKKTCILPRVLTSLSVIMCIIAMTVGTAPAQERGGQIADTLSTRFLRQVIGYPQEKIYIHTDRDHYVSGDTIWLRAHVVNAVTHTPDSISRYVYADLIDPSGSIVNNIKMICMDGIYSGHMRLMEGTPAGSYTLRAYTNFMKNAGQEYFPVKRIRISDIAMFTIKTDMEFAHRRNGRVKGILNIQDMRPGHSSKRQDIYISVNGNFVDMPEISSAGTVPFSVKLPDVNARNVVSITYDAYSRLFTIPAPNDEFDVSFYPEGGYMVDMATCAVGFKALRKDGRSLPVSGKIVDSDGESIVEFKSTYKGMGIFHIIPYKGKKYYAECTGPEGTVKRFELPEVRRDVATLQLKRMKGQMLLAISHSPDFRHDGPLTVVMHIRGNMLTAQKIEPGRFMKLDLSTVPSGVMHILLLDNKMNVLSERLTFISNDDQTKGSVSTDKKSYRSRQHIKAMATITDAKGKPVTGSFSVAVTDDKVVSPDSTSNILTELLLTSDLKGYIEDPGWYFSDDPMAQAGLEALMLTQGWRRYDIPKVLKGEYHSPKEYLERGEVISGKVFSLWRPVSITDATVTLLHKEMNYFDNQEVDEKGTFSFQGFEIPEGSSIMVQALSPKRKGRVELFVDQLPETPVDPMLLVQDATTNVTEAADTALLLKTMPELTEDELKNTITIEEITVSGKKEKKGFYSGLFLMGRTYNKRFIDMVKIDKMELLFLRILPIMMKIPDSTGQLAYTYKDKPVRFIYDDWDVDSLHVDYFLSLDTKDLQSIEVAKDFETMPFGVSTNGEPIYGAVISVHSKEGKGILNTVERNYNKKLISPLGFQKPIEFYSPRYHTRDELARTAKDMRTTLYWNPNLRTGNDGKASFEFYSADSPSTSYSIVIEGVTDDGKIVHTEGSVKIN